MPWSSYCLFLGDVFDEFDQKVEITEVHKDNGRKTYAVIFGYYI